MKKSVILVLLLFSFVSFVSATDCAVKTVCLPTEINILDVSSISNAHVSAENINYMQLCCPRETTGITNSEVSQTCEGINPLNLYSLDNSHIAIPPSTIYLNKLCIDSGVQCRTSQLGCLDTEFCLLKYKEETGFTDTNAHVADCSDDFYSKSICCSSSGSGGECLEEAELCSTDSECCDISQGYTKDQYCSSGQYENLVEKHCCEEGTFWNQQQGICEGAEPCYDPTDPLGNPGICNYLISEPEGYFNLDEEDCIQYNLLYQYHEACCNKNRYGTNDFYFCEIEIL